MKPDAFPGRAKATFEINARMFGSAACAWVAWMIWPTRPEWWGFGFLSLILWTVALSATIQTVKLIIAVWQRNRAIAAFEADKSAPKSAAVANLQRLKDAGMIR